MNLSRVLRVAAMLAGLFPWTDSRAFAHAQSYGFLNLAIGSDSIDGTLDLAARDLDALFDLDQDRDAKVTWSEFHAREATVARAVLERISIDTAMDSCVLSGRSALTDSRGGETYIIIPFSGRCHGLEGPIDISYRLLFDIDEQHRGLVNVTTAAGAQNFVMTPGAQQVTLSSGGESWVSLILTWVAHGIHHILIGYDHILFVITLLLGTAMQHRNSSVWLVLTETAKVVTAFTLSHSITLGLAALGVLQVPVVLAESLIAATIALAAANNLWPIVTKRIWLVALAFGLIHGIGFANVLTELGLPRGNLLASLLAFNIGVEIGQLIIVAAALPVILLASQRQLGRYAMPAANLAIAAVAILWFSDRAFSTALMPF